MRTSILLFVLVALSILANAQNMVRNHSFEEFVDCPDEVTVESKKELIPFWYLPNRGTTDYFNSCAFYQVNVPDNIMGHMFALHGDAYIGLVLIEQPPSDSKLKRPLQYREYLQTELTAPLKKDSLYCMQFYFCIASYSTYAIDKLGMYVSEKALSNRFSTKVLHAEPQISLDTNKTFTERDNWYQVCGTFKARGNEQYITIGNFYDDNDTKVEKMDYSIYRGTIQQTIKENKIAYYYIDYVSVVPISDTTSNYCENHFSADKRVKTKQD